MGAADAFLEKRGKFIFVGYRMAASMAHFVAAGFELVVDGDAIVEDETVALPEALVGIDFFKVIEDAAIKVVDFGETLLEQERS